MRPPSVEDQVEQFAQRIENLLASVVLVSEEDYVFTAAPEGTYARGGNTRYVITQREERGIPLFCEGEEILFLSYMFSCSCRHSGSWLQVDSSSLKLVCGDGTPLLHYDYTREATHNTPGAHLNVHASNDTVSQLMLSCMTGKRGRSRRQKFVKSGIFPTFSNLHLPVGGDRLRPCLEDVLQMTIYEFDIDVKDGWQVALEESRAEYRKRQIRAIVREFPDLAYQTLIDEGYDLRFKPERPNHVGTEGNLTRY